MINSHEPVKSYARNILIAAEKINYQEPIILSDSGLKSSKKKKFKGVKEASDEHILTVYPNPANDYFEVKITLANFTGQELIQLFNPTGILLKLFPIISKQDQFIISTKNLKPGLYLIVLEAAGKRKDSVKITVLK